MKSWLAPGVVLLLLAAMAPTLAAQTVTPPSQVPSSSPVSVEASPQLFATMCALYASGFQIAGSATTTDPDFAALRTQLLALHGPATEALRAYYRDHVLADDGATMSRYVTFALTAGPAPKFAIAASQENLPPDVLALDGFSEVLANFYQEAQIEQRWRQLQPVYERDASSLNAPLGQIVLTEIGYLRELLHAGQRTFTVYSEPLAGGTTNFRNIGNHYVVVVNPAIDSFDMVRHAFLHFLLDPLPIQYAKNVGAEQPLFRIAERAPQLPYGYREDFSAFFTECLVRAVELRVRRLSPAQLAGEVNSDEGDGYVLVRPIIAALAKFEASEPAMSLYFPDLVGSIDVAAESKRLQAVAFTPASDSEASAPHGASAESHSPVSLGSEVDSELGDGDRLISTQNAPAAQAVFERVLAKIPGQPRALYGLAVASVLQGDVDRAITLFGMLVDAASDASTATAMRPDANQLAWSHVYLGRIDDLEDDREAALKEYRAALAVVDAPEAARAAAQRGIENPPAVHDPSPG